MAATSILLLATAITLGVTLILAIALVARARLRSYVRCAPLDSIRSSLWLEIVASVALLLAALGVARQLGAADLRPMGSSRALWPLVGLPASAAAICFGLYAMAAPARPTGTPPRPFASLWMASALVAGAITVLLILSGRLVLTDALLIMVAVPSWMWMVAEWRPGLRHPVRPAPPTPDDEGVSPGPPILLLSVALGALLVFIGARAPFPLVADALAGGGLLALLLPLALAGAGADLDADRADRAAAPIFLAATVAPLVGLAAATLAHVLVIISRAGNSAVRVGAPWHVGAVESLVSVPYLSGLSRLITPALLALALPLLAIALTGVSPRVRRAVGFAVILSGIALGASGLAST